MSGDGQPNDRRAAAEEIAALVKQVKACRICVESPAIAPLPHEPRPVLVLSHTARIGIAGQAPGTRVHKSGRPFTDPSGDRLRDWMGIGPDVFYDEKRIAIMPMGFCFPGLDVKGGDLPPRPECASFWRDRVMETASSVRLWLVVGQYAHKWHFGGRRSKTLTETVSRWRELSEPVDGKRLFPLPHPSWRNNSWIAKNPWFERELLPDLRKLVSTNL